MGYNLLISVYSLNLFPLHILYHRHFLKTNHSKFHLHIPFPQPTREVKNYLVLMDLVFNIIKDIEFVAKLALIQLIINS